MRLFIQYPHLKELKQLARAKKAKIFLVGGFLRDYLAATPKADFDFAVDKNAIALAKSFARKIKGAFIILDEERGCARVARKTPEGLLTYDFSDFRAKTFEADLRARDFTVNTLYVDILTADEKLPLKQLIKGHPLAFKDIRLKTIRMVSPQAFVDDPLRMLRAYSLKAQLRFAIPSATRAQIKKNAALINQVSFERVRDELFKILQSDGASEIFKEMDATGLLVCIMPQIKVMYKCRQGGYHHLDVWPHSLETVRQLENVLKDYRDEHPGDIYLNEDLGGGRPRYALMKLAALLHDIGKPDTKKKEPDGRTSFHGHEHVGRNITREIARQIKISTHERHALEDMVLWHLRPGYLSNFKVPSDKAVYRYFRDTKTEALSIALLSMADQMSTRGPLTKKEDERHHLKICRRLIARYLEKQKETPFISLINGHDLIKNLKLKPSPLFGIILESIKEKQVLGEVTNKKEALAMAKDLAKKNKP